jgi:hypothetical protein
MKTNHKTDKKLLIGLSISGIAPLSESCHLGLYAAITKRGICKGPHWNIWNPGTLELL